MQDVSMSTSFSRHLGPAWAAFVTHFLAIGLALRSLALMGDPREAYWPMLALYLSAFAFFVLAARRALTKPPSLLLVLIGAALIRASVLGLPISGSDALLLGSVYFLIGVFSPFGMLGTREAGTIGAAALFGVSSAAIGDGGEGPIAAAVVFITAIEAVVNLGCAGFGVAWLRIGSRSDPITVKEE